MNLPINTPTLLLDKNKCLTNIAKMAAKAKRSNVILRPHFKTHQSHEVGRWFREYGVTSITVSSLKMAEYFAEDGWRDITVAFPVNILEIDRINRLAKRIHLNLVFESLETLRFIDEKLRYPVALFLKIDTGYHRTGIDVHDINRISEILSEFENTENVEFAGFLVHAGHSYQCKSDVELLTIHEESKRQLLQLKTRFYIHFPNLKISVGDTPTCSVAEDFKFADEIRPGNFVFYDVMQSLIGSCQLEDISVALACPVVAKHEARVEIIIYGGGVHLSKDRCDLPINKEPFFGYIAKLRKDVTQGWQILSPKNYVKSLSQEHGIIKITKECWHQINIGDILIILPIHSCMTADLLREYMTLDGDIITAGKY